MVLSNGDRLTGTIVHKSGDALTLVTEHAGRLRIAWSGVATLRTDAPIELLRAVGEVPVRGWLEEAAPGQVAFRPVGAAGVTPIALADLLFLNPKPEESGLGTAYQGRVTLSLAQARGNSTTDRAQGEGQLNARARDYRYRLDGALQRADEAGQQVASRSAAGANYDRFLGTHAFAYLRSALEHDRFKDIELRASAGAGFGVRLLDTARTALSLRAGIDAISLDRIQAEDERYPALGWSVEWSYWPIETRLQLFHDQTGYWNLERRNELSWRSRSGLPVPIAQGYTLNAQLNVDWERAPPPGRRSTDTTLLLGAGVEW